MSQAVQPQHPAVVLRSHYQHVRALLAIAMTAVIGLTLALVIVASNSGGSNSTHSLTSSASPRVTTPYNGGHEEGASGSSAAPPSLIVRYDGGPEEGTTGPGR